MNAKLSQQEIPDAGDAPITRADLRDLETRLRTDLAKRLDGVAGRFDLIDMRLERINDNMATDYYLTQLFKLVKSIGERLGKHDQIKSRVSSS